MHYPAEVAVDLDSVDRCLRQCGEDRVGTLRAEIISGGRSNITIRLDDDASSWILRRPPAEGLTPSAHDMTREYRVISALSDSAVPVPRAVFLCEDPAVVGAPFYIAEHVAGTVVRTRSQLDGLDDHGIRRCVTALIRTLADLHEIDHETAGLAEFGRPQGYLDRQVHRWRAQWAHVRQDSDPSDSDVERLHQALQATVPRRSRVAVVHGDYRIDNTITDPADPGRIHAVLDWELSTLGDPLSDAALMCVYRHPALDLILDTEAAWTSPRLPSTDQLAQQYSAIAGVPLDDWAFYLALGYFKLAVIAAGIAHRGQFENRGAPRSDAHKAVGPLLAAGLASARIGDSR